jgi:hypothetical protein
MFYKTVKERPSGPRAPSALEPNIASLTFTPVKALPNISFFFYTNFLLMRERSYLNSISGLSSKLKIYL